MVAAREARRAANRAAKDDTGQHAATDAAHVTPQPPQAVATALWATAPWATASPAVPGAELVLAGLQDLAAGTESEDALLVSIAAPRLRLVGIPVPPAFAHPEARLFARLAHQHGDGAHSRYNALVRRLVSFARAAAAVASHA